MYKILNITEEGRGGGAMGRMRIVAKTLSDKINTIIVFPRSATKYKISLDRDSIDSIPIRLHSLTKSRKGAVAYVFSFVPEVWSIIKIIKKIQPDLIQTNGAWQIKGVIAGWITGRKVLWHMNDSYQGGFVRRLFKYVSPLSSAFSHASSRTLQYYEEISPSLLKKPSNIIQAPVDTQSIGFIERKRSQKIRFLTVGYINVHKGLELLIGAAAQIVDREVEFHIIGPVLDTQIKYMNSLLDLQSKLEANSVTFLGYKKIDATLLSQYDYYLCSSIREASPMAVWEALSSGMPIVSTDVGDVRQVIKQYDCGQLVEVFDSSALVKGIVTIMNQDNDAYSEMSQRARKAAVDLFDLKKISTAYLHHYIDLICETTN